MKEVEIFEAEDIELRLHYDKNGSWIEVPMLLLMLMNMPPAMFSKFSRVHEGHMYLEEDLDAYKFLLRFEFLYGKKPELLGINHGEDALTIRGYNKNAEGQDVTIH